MWELAEARTCLMSASSLRKPEGLKKYAEMGEELKCELIAREGRRGLLRIHARAALHRFLPRPARALHLEDQGLQAALDRGRVLEGRRAQPAAAAHLRHRVLHAARSSTSTLNQLEEAKKRDHRKLGQELDLFSIQELAGPGLIFFTPRAARSARILEDWMRDQYVAARLLAGLHAAHRPARSVEDLRPLQFLRREHVQADGAGRRRIPAQADELPVPHPDLSATRCRATATCRCGSASSARCTATSARA